MPGTALIRPFPLVRSAGLTGVTAALVFTSFVGRVSGEESLGTYRLRYRFDSGTAVRYVVENQAEIDVQQAGAQQHVEHTETTEKHYHVLSTDDDGNAVLELTIDRVRMSASIDGDDPVTFDSASEEPPPAQFVGVAGTVGRPHARIKASPTGELLSIEWLLPGKHQALPTEEDAGNLDILVRMPEEPIAVHGEWKDRFETEVAVNERLKKKVTLLRTYRLVSVEDGRATIRLKTAVITPLQDPAQEAQLIQKTPSGTIEFDLERGVLISRKTQLDREVVGFNGGKSRIRNVTNRNERLAGIESGTSSRSVANPAPAAR